MALFHTTVVDNQIKALSTIGSASGSIATFETDKAERLVNLEVAITATQSGSGTPSPSNPRTINGFSACNLSVNGTTETISFGQTIYGGSLNVVSGVLTVTHGSNLVPTASSYSQSGGHNYTYFSPTGMKSESGSHFDVISEVVTANGALGDYFTIYRINTLCVIGVPDNYSLSDYNSQIAGTKVLFPLASETTIQLDSKQIQTIANSVNNVYADTGDIIDLKFVLSVGKAIS